MGWRPYQVEVTRVLKPGRNRVAVEVTNSLRNLLGPHHHRGDLSFVSAASFCDEENWTDRYNYVPCGLKGRALLVALDSV